MAPLQVWGPSVQGSWEAKVVASGVLWSLLTHLWTLQSISIKTSCLWPPLWVVCGASFDNGGVQVVLLDGQPPHRNGAPETRQAQQQAVWAELKRCHTAKKDFCGVAQCHAVI